jgi:ATP-binding cassette subfamily F protein 3
VKPLAAAIARLEQRIAVLEAEQKRIEPQLADPAIYQDFARAQPLLDGFRSNKEELERLYADWEAQQEQLARVSV